jgi:glycerol-3-phosphate dehydrogenase
MSPVHERPSLDGQHFDVVVIGGGISGIAVAKACSAGGKRTLVVEQHDFGSGTSSRSTRIIHGGLRYLENLEVGLVRESLRERGRLLRERPHLVRPMRFLLAFPQMDPLSLRNPIAVRFGLWLYQQMGGSPREVPIARLPEWESWRVFDYEDAQCEFPERLIAEWLAEALAAGCAARNYTESLAIIRVQGRVTAVRLRDRLTGQECQVQAKQVINATGPWADRICAQSNIGDARMLNGVRGSHIVLPRFPGLPSAAVYTEAVDGRPFFVIPWNGQTLVGTTEVADGGDPGSAQPTPREIDYLWRSFERVFPSSGLSSGDIRYAFAGIRPLPRSEERTLGQISRRYYLHDHTAEGAAGMWSILGGKLTTAAAEGRHCARLLGAHAPEPATPIIATGPANGYAATLAQWARQASDSTRLCSGEVTAQSARAIAEWHGRRALGILRSSCQRADLTLPLCDHTEHIVGEALHAVAVEGAVTLADILLRRVPVALSGDWNAECAHTAARRIGAAFGWGLRRVEQERESFVAERARFLQSPLPGGATPVRQDVA